MTALARITANLLATARYIAIVNLVVFILSSQFSRAGFSLQILLSAWLFYLHIRIYFDQQLFVNLAYHHLTGEELDHSLNELNLKKISENRPLVERAKGTVSLWKQALYVTAAQFLVLFLQT